MVTIVWALAALSLAAWGGALFHLAHLPVAPQCPDCRGVTSHPVRTTVLDRLLGHVGNSAARECTRCGWSGRMRWRIALRRTRAE